MLVRLVGRGLILAAGGITGFILKADSWAAGWMERWILGRAPGRAPDL